jgi:hypothetical protein
MVVVQVELGVDKVVGVLGQLAAQQCTLCLVTVAREYAQLSPVVSNFMLVAGLGQ